MIDNSHHNAVMNELEMETAKAHLQAAHYAVEANKTTLDKVQNQPNIRVVTISQVAATLLAGSVPSVTSILTALTVARKIVSTAEQTDSMTPEQFKEFVKQENEAEKKRAINEARGNTATTSQQQRA
jgi:hypothetical protein